MQSCSYAILTLLDVRTKELFASAGLLDYLHQSRLQLLNRRHMIGKYTHLSRLRGYVHLDSERWQILAQVRNHWKDVGGGQRTHRWTYRWTREKDSIVSYHKTE